MEQYTKAHSMEFHSYPSRCYDTDSTTHFNTCLRSEPLTNLENFSVSVIYQPMDFPFPSIRCHSQSEDLLDSQFSIGCIHGGGSMLSSLDVSLESCLGMFFCM